MRCGETIATTQKFEVLTKSPLHVQVNKIKILFYAQNIVTVKVVFLNPFRILCLIYIYIYIANLQSFEL